MIRKRHLAGFLVLGLVPVAALSAPPYDPSVPVPAASYTPIPQIDSMPQVGEIDWRQANETVAQFPRGHIDVLRWEAANPAEVQTEAPSQAQRMSASRALRLALDARPDLMAKAQMNPLELARVNIELAVVSRDVLRAWVSAVAADMSLEKASKAYAAAQTGAELAVRMVQVGNWGRDSLLNEQLAMAEAGAGLIAAQQRATQAREALVRKTGLWGEATQFELPEQLPELPAEAIDSAGLESLALAQHPLLAVTSQDAERARRSLGAATQERWRALREEAVASVLANIADDASALSGLPVKAAVIDFQRAALEGSAAHAFGAIAEAETLAVKVRSQVREAYVNYRIAHDLASQALGRKDMHAARQEEVLLRYNGMLKSTWDLLDAARERLAADTAAAQAMRDFWLAHVNLQAVLAGADYQGGDAVAQPAGSKAAGGH